MSRLTICVDQVMHWSTDSNGNKCNRDNWLAWLKQLFKVCYLWLSWPRPNSAATISVSFASAPCAHSASGWRPGEEGRPRWLSTGLREYSQFAASFWPCAAGCRPCRSRTPLPASSCCSSSGSSQLRIPCLGTPGLSLCTLCSSGASLSFCPAVFCLCSLFQPGSSTECSFNWVCLSLWPY